MRSGGMPARLNAARIATCALSASNCLPWRWGKTMRYSKMGHSRNFAPLYPSIGSSGEYYNHPDIGIEAKNPYVLVGDTVQISLCDGTFAVVDASDFHRVAHLRWSPDGNGYAQTRLCHQGKITNPRLHGFLLGEEADGWFVDHVSGCRADCRRANLRRCTRAQNVLNRAVNVSSAFGYKGVRQHKSGFYFVQIKNRGKQYRVGEYETPEEAGRAYDFLARKFFGEWARLNFP